jgi:ATP-dependent Lhr-like helicase
LGAQATTAEDAARSQSFDLLHEAVRRWIWSKEWDSLRDIQEAAIPAILDGRRDLIISAGTASGKTEAAFLPIISRLAEDEHKAGDGFGCVYVCPLKALINDQFGRMESLCEVADIPVVKWHGDASQAKKVLASKKPGGVLLITPESLEAILIRRGQDVARLFRGLKFIVIDEMHVFMDVARGCQLLSVIHRIEKAAGVDACRIGLSATLADEAASKRFLRPLDPERVKTLPSGPTGTELRLQLRGYLSTPSAPRYMSPEERSAWVDPADAAIHRDLFALLRGGRHLIFAGSRNRVETVTDALTAMCEAKNLPQEFFAHHANLAKEYREDSEARMKDQSNPSTIVCTSTLELGIDVGDIETVAQLGAGHTVSGMRQRLGRSGRRAGQASTMRVFLKEADLKEVDHPIDGLRLDTFQTVAMVNLMLKRWNEPPQPGRLNLSTMVHQLLALIGQGGGISPTKAWSILGSGGVFPGVSLDVFKDLLRQLGSEEVIEQADDGTLLPGRVGEQILSGKDVYSVFISGEEYKVISDDGRPIGQVPVENPIQPGQYLLLGGRRWQVLDVHASRREILVTRSRGGKPPIFGGEKPIPSDGVIEEMRRLYEAEAFPPYLDAQAKRFVAEGRETFERNNLRHTSSIRYADNLYLVPWVGGRRLNSLFLALVAAETEATLLGIAIFIPGRNEDAAKAALARLRDGVVPPAEDLAKKVEQKAFEKFDHLLGDRLLNLSYASERLDVEALPEIAGTILARW